MINVNVGDFELKFHLINFFMFWFESIAVESV
jgi:hypothetical protein